MRHLPQFLIKWLDERNRKNETPWPRETPWRQGSVLPLAQAVSLRLIDKTQPSTKIAIVVTHDCDLANEITDEPNVEVIVGILIRSCLPDKTHAKNVRILHIDINGPGGRKALELVARNKTSIPKRRMSNFGPDSVYSIGKTELETLRSWLAARYRRASIPDGLQALVKDVFEEIAKKKDRPLALRGIWIDFDPDSDLLESGEKYELWIVIVYSTSVEGSKAVAEEMARQIHSKFEKKYCKNGVWTGLDLRECVARSDTEFTYYDTYRYKVFRLEHWSIRAKTSSEIGNE